jgi:hypothetical protein
VVGFQDTLTQHRSSSAYGFIVVLMGQTSHLESPLCIDGSLQYEKLHVKVHVLLLRYHEKVLSQDEPQAGWLLFSKNSDLSEDAHLAISR